MNWNLAVEKNLEALRRVLALLGAMVAMTGGSDTPTARSATLPRHLHRYVLRLLRPAEAATRRLIIIAARGLAVSIRPYRVRKAKRVNEPKIVYVLDRVNGSIVNVPVVLPDPVPEPVPSRPAKRSATPLFPLLDPLKRFGARRRYAKPGAKPNIRLLGDGDSLVPLFRRPNPAPLPPPMPSLDDPLDAGNLYRRLEAIARVLDDLPGQAKTHGALAGSPGCEVGTRAGGRRPRRRGGRSGGAGRERGGACPMFPGKVAARLRSIEHCRANRQAPPLQPHGAAETGSSARMAPETQS